MIIGNVVSGLGVLAEMYQFYKQINDLKSNFLKILAECTKNGKKILIFLDMEMT